MFDLQQIMEDLLKYEDDYVHFCSLFMTIDSWMGIIIFCLDYIHYVLCMHIYIKVIFLDKANNSYITSSMCMAHLKGKLNQEK